MHFSFSVEVCVRPLGTEWRCSFFIQSLRNLYHFSGTYIALKLEVCKIHIFYCPHKIYRGILTPGTGRLGTPLPYAQV